MNATDQCLHGSSNLVTTYREELRSTRIAVPVFGLPSQQQCRQIPPQPGLINQPKLIKATRHANEKNSTEVHGDGGLELVKWARQSASSRPEISFPPRAQDSPGSSTIELPSALAGSGAYTPDREGHNTLAHDAVLYQPFSDNITCLLRATLFRRATNSKWGLEEQAHRVYTVEQSKNG